jgi:DNA-binding MarR family transcriptional regulator
MNLIVKNLESRNIVTRSSSKTHGKKLDTSITTIGKSILKKANNIVLSIEDEIFGHLSKEEAEMLSNLLKKIIN